MFDNRQEMQIAYIDPDRRALFVAEMPDGGFTAWTQKGDDAPRKLISHGYIKREGYATRAEAQNALDLHVSNFRDSNWYRWDVLINGKNVGWDDYHAMCRGEMLAPDAVPHAQLITLSNIEYRIATHMQGAYQNILEVGHCLNEAKEAELVPHGQWESWVCANTGMSERQAQRLMQASRSVRAGSAMERLPITKIQAILALPEPEREPMAEKAASENMSLRQLQAQIKEQKARAEVAERRATQAEKEREAAKRDAQAYLSAKQGLEKGERNLRDQLSLRRAEIERLEKAIEAASNQGPSSVGISAEAQAEIDRLRAEIEEAEAYAERQADLRQQAQRELLSQQAQAARGETPTIQEGLTTFELAAAVRAFVGSVGVLPHMGATMAAATEAERREMRQYIDMVATWVDGAQQALNIVYITGEEA